MKLINPTDDELNACFAVKVAGHVPPFELREEYEEDGDSDGFRNILRGADGRRIPTYITSADAVLPWLEEWHVEAGRLLMLDCWLVLIRKDAVTKNYYRATGKTFARAAVIALLMAHGFEIEIPRETGV